MAEKMDLTQDCGDFASAFSTHSHIKSESCQKLYNTEWRELKGSEKSFHPERVLRSLK